jgi:kumamolisin
MRGAHSVGKADPAERFEVSVLLRYQDHQALHDRVAELARGHRPTRHLTREEFAQRHGADPADIAKVRQFATSHGLTVVEEDAARQTVVLSGTVAQFNDAFGVDLETFEHPGGTYRGRTGPIHLPDELVGIVTAVLGLDNRPQAHPRFRVRPAQGNVRWSAAAAEAGSFTPTELASLYGFPAGTGHGECIAIIELGGGYRTADL